MKHRHDMGEHHSHGHHDHEAQERRVHEAMQKAGHHHPVGYHHGIIHVERNTHKEPHERKSSLALHTNHRPGMDYSDEVMR